MRIFFNQCIVSVVGYKAAHFTGDGVALNGKGENVVCSQWPVWGLNPMTLEFKHHTNQLR